MKDVMSVLVVRFLDGDLDLSRMTIRSLDLYFPFWRLFEETDCFLD